MQGAFLLTATIGEWSALQRSLGLSSLAMLGLFAAYLLAAAVTAPIGGRPAVADRCRGPRNDPDDPRVGYDRVGYGERSVAARPRCDRPRRRGLGVVAALVWQGGAWRTRAAVTLAGAAVLALILGPAVAALLEPATGWRWTFLLAAPAAMVVLLVTVASEIALLVRRASTPLPG
jgi:hypothetical protein